METANCCQLQTNTFTVQTSCDLIHCFICLYNLYLHMTAIRKQNMQGNLPTTVASYQYIIQGDEFAKKFRVGKLPRLLVLEKTTNLKWTCAKLKTLGFCHRLCYYRVYGNTHRHDNTKSISAKTIVRDPSYATHNKMKLTQVSHLGLIERERASTVGEFLLTHVSQILIGQ